MTFLELAEKILMEEGKPLTASEIWHYAIAKRYDVLLNTTGKTPWSTLGALIYVNSKDNPKSPFLQTGSRPKKFYLKRLAEKTDLMLNEPGAEYGPGKKLPYLEKDLHCYLTYYAYLYQNYYTKTIRHFQSSKKEFGEWVHPDMVGVYYPIESWKPEVYELSSEIGNISVKLVSYELKRELNFGNLRESFFQTVSNSSWANESYLVTAMLSKDSDFIDELTRLSTSFGIGIIELNVQEPDSSGIFLPAKYRETLDWETVNKLAMNPDFKEFLSRVKIDISSKKIHKKEYDVVPDVDDLKQKVKVQKA